MSASDILFMMRSDIGSLTFSEKMIGASMVTVLSMAIVFFVLLILLGSIKMIRLVFASKEISQGSVPEEPHSIDVQSAISDERELIAVISAAVAAAMGKSESEIRVINVVRTREASIWAKSGWIGQMNGRL